MGITPRFVNSDSNNTNPFIFLFAGNRYSWSLKTDMPDWLIPMNGQTIENLETLYPDLWAVKDFCPFIVPSRGNFGIRDYNGDGKFARAGRVPGIQQNSSLYIGALQLRYAISNGTGTNRVSEEENGFLHASSSSREDYGAIKQNDFYVRGGKNETRPTNVSEVWCLITKNITVPNN